MGLFFLTGKLTKAENGKEKQNHGKTLLTPSRIHILRQRMIHDDGMGDRNNSARYSCEYGVYNSLESGILTRLSRLRVLGITNAHRKRDLEDIPKKKNRRESESLFSLRASLPTQAEWIGVLLLSIQHSSPFSEKKAPFSNKWSTLQKSSPGYSLYPGVLLECRYYKDVGFSPKRHPNGHLNYVRITYPQRLEPHRKIGTIHATAVWQRNARAATCLVRLEESQQREHISGTTCRYHITPGNCSL